MGAEGGKKASDNRLAKACRRLHAHVGGWGDGAALGKRTSGQNGPYVNTVRGEAVSHERATLVSGEGEECWACDREQAGRGSACVGQGGPMCLPVCAFYCAVQQVECKRGIIRHCEIAVPRVPEALRPGLEAAVEGAVARAALKQGSASGQAAVRLAFDGCLWPWPSDVAVVPAGRQGLTDRRLGAAHQFKCCLNRSASGSKEAKPAPLPPRCCRPPALVLQIPASLVPPGHPRGAGAIPPQNTPMHRTTVHDDEHSTAHQRTSRAMLPTPGHTALQPPF